MPQKKIKITLERTTGETIMHLQLPLELEKFFKGLSQGNINQSKVWFDKDGKGARFYALNKEYLEMEKGLDNRAFNNWGKPLIENQEHINLAPLRTVGTSSEKGISIKSKGFNSLTDIEMEYYIRQLGILSKKLWETYVAKRKIIAEITYSVV